MCWPICYEEVLRRLELQIPVGRDSISFDVDRVTIEPYDLRQPCPYDLVIDRLTHWYDISREWIKKAVVMDDLYVFNNPWTVQGMEKHTSYVAMMTLGLPIPETWMLPAKEYEDKPDLKVTLERYARLFDLGDVGGKIGYPMFMKPYDGGGWTGVSRIENEEQLRQTYDQSGTHLMHLQKAVEPFDLFVRSIGLGPQTYTVRYDPSAPLHDRYTMERDFLSEEDSSLLHDMTLTINAFFGWDFNSCEALRSDGTWFPIDFANPCPDSQVTSLHYHFPWLIKANIRWSVFCAALNLSKEPNPEWKPFLRINKKKGLSYREKITEYAAIANKRFRTDDFWQFCDEHLSHLDEVVWEFFGTQVARDAVRQKVAALFPPHEVEEFTDLFWARIQKWREDDKAGVGTATPR